MSSIRANINLAHKAPVEVLVLVFVEVLEFEKGQS